MGRLKSILFLLFFYPTLSTTLKWLGIHSSLDSYNNGVGGGGGGSFGGGDRGSGRENHIQSCDHYAFINKQVKFCKNNPVLFDSIRIAASKSIQECQYQFRYNKWNCSLDLTAFGGNHNSRRNQRALLHSSQQQVQSPQELQPQQLSSSSSSATTNNKQPTPTVQTQSQQQLLQQLQQNQNQPQILNQNQKQHHQHKRKFPEPLAGTRESAFIHSLSSAGVAHQLTKACSAGASPDCGCDKSLSDSKSSSFKWAGCSDNIDYGVSLSRAFVDALDHRMSRKNKTVSIALVNLHNNELGRKIITRLMRIECKCHGVSGSCEIRTCWRVMPNLRQIGEFLRSKFEYAKMVEEKRLGSRRGLAHKVPGQSFTDLDLVYLKRSPDFCTSNLKRGSLGTKGRVCKQVKLSHKDNVRQVSVPDSCAALCCDRGHTTNRVHKAERCKCKFQWCCAVHCSECVKEVEISTCN